VYMHHPPRYRKIIVLNFFKLNCGAKIYMLLAGWEVRIVKNCDRGLEIAARGNRLRAAFSSPRSQFFTKRTDPKPDNIMFIFFSCGKLTYKWVCLRSVVTELAYALSTDSRNRS